MKILKNVFLLAFLSVLTISCDSDDDDDFDFASIIGTWVFVSSTTDGVQDPPEDCPWELTFSANQIDGTDYYGDNCEEMDFFTIDYSIDGDIVTINEDGYEFTMRILTLSETTLTIEDSDDGVVYTETFRRQ